MDHHKYQLGDAVNIQVAKADIERKLLDFTIAKDEIEKTKK